MAIAADGETTQNADIQIDFELPETIVGINIEDRLLYLTVIREFGSKTETDYINVQNDSYIIGNQPQGTVITIAPEFVKSGYAAIRCAPITLQIGITIYTMAESQIMPDGNDVRDKVISDVLERLKNKADKSSPIINNKLYIQTGENNGTKPTAPYMSIFPTSEGACIRFGEGYVMTPTLRISDGGLFFNQDTDDHMVYTELHRPPASAMSRISTSGEIDCKTTALWILKLSSAKELTILNPWYSPRGTILIPSGYVVPILPANSINADGFPETVTAPARLDFVYDKTNYWWTCTKYNT